jgi:hypothetical protein
MALIDAADPYVRPVIATLAGAGLRIGEAVARDWRDVKLGVGTLVFRESKQPRGRGERLICPSGSMRSWRPGGLAVRAPHRAIRCSSTGLATANTDARPFGMSRRDS